MHQGREEDLSLIRGILRQLGFASPEEPLTVGSLTILGNDLFSMAREWERENAALAVQFYSLFEQAFAERPRWQVLVRRAAQRRELMSGQAPLIRQIPQLMEQVLETALDPVMIGSFLVAGGVSRVVGIGASRLLASRAPIQYLQRGLGNRAAAGSLAFAAEVPSFVGATHGLRMAIHGDSMLSSEIAWRHEMTGAGLFLGSLKLAGVLSSQILQGFSVQGNWLAFGQAAGTVLGVHTGHHLEEHFGFRPVGRSEWNRLAETFGTYLQLQAAGRLLAGINPSHLAVRPISSEAMDRGLRHLMSVRDLANLPANAESPGGFGESSILPSGVRNDLWQALPTRLSQIWNYSLRGALHQIGERAGDVEAWSRLLSQTRLANTAATSDSFFRLRQAMQFTNTRGEQGSYLNWVTRLTLQELVHQGNVQGLEALMGAVYRGSSARKFEKLLAMYLPDLTISQQGSILRRGREYFDREARVLRSRYPINLGTKARGVLYRALQRMETLPLQSDLRVGADQWIGTFYDVLQQQPRLVYPVTRVLEMAVNSPLGYLRVHRLYRIFAHEPGSVFKISELTDTVLRLRDVSERSRYPTNIYKIRNSQMDAYMGDQQLVEYLRSLHRRLPNLLANDQINERGTRRQAILRELWPETRSLTQGDLVSALEHLGDSLSLCVVQAIRAREVAVEILSSADFNDLARRHNGHDQGDSWQAFILYPEKTGGPPTMYLRDIYAVSYPVFINQVFLRLSNMVHEYEHALRPILRPRTDHSLLTEEMIAHVRTIDWRAQHGAVDRLELLTQNATQSLAMSLRDQLEAWYLLTH